MAIKKVKEQYSDRFKQEARSIAALNHPNICQIFDIGDDYLVLEYVEGKPLSSPLAEQEAVRLAIQIASALEAAHKKDIIHRDLKPRNIMVADEGAVKLLDFGLAKLYEQDASVSSLPTADMPATQAGAILGTVAYMSPMRVLAYPKPHGKHPRWRALFLTCDLRRGTCDGIFGAAGQVQKKYLNPPCLVESI